MTSKTLENSHFWQKGSTFVARPSLAEKDIDAAENENERNQVAWLEERIAQRDAKIDAIYVELREEQSAHLEDIHKRYVAELQLKEAELSRCDLWECLKRIPPKFKNKIKEEQL